MVGALAFSFKSVCVIFFSEGKGCGLVFGVPLSKCIANDTELRRGKQRKDSLDMMAAAHHIGRYTHVHWAPSLARRRQNKREFSRTILVSSDFIVGGLEHFFPVYSCVLPSVSLCTASFWAHRDMERRSTPKRKLLGTRKVQGTLGRRDQCVSVSGWSGPKAECFWT